MFALCCCTALQLLFFLSFDGTCNNPYLTGSHQAVTRFTRAAYYYTIRKNRCTSSYKLKELRKTILRSPGVPQLISVLPNDFTTWSCNETRETMEMEFLLWDTIEGRTAVNSFQIVHIHQKSYRNDSGCPSGATGGQTGMVGASSYPYEAMHRFFLIILFWVTAWWDPVIYQFIVRKSDFYSRSFVSNLYFLFSTEWENNL